MAQPPYPCIYPTLTKRGWLFTDGSTREADTYPRKGYMSCPYGIPGDRLWVRETLGVVANWGTLHYVADDGVCYDPDHQKADFPFTAEAEAIVERYGDSYFANEQKRVPSIFMPRWASRIALEIVKVRVERVQDISEGDAIAEGLLSAIGDGGGPGAGYKWSGIGYHGAGFARDGAHTFHVPDTAGRCRCVVAGPTPAQCAYRELWDSINAKRGYGWDANPWVWVIEFKRVTGAL